MKRELKNLAKQGLFELFVAGQRLGVDVLPRHFYSGIADVGELRRTQLWRRPRSMRHIAGSALDGQLAFARSICRPELIADALADDVYAAAGRRNGEPGYGPIEGVFLYAFTRAVKPKRVLQVGCGVSTAIMLAAARKEGFSTQITCIDPFPTEFLRKAASAGEIVLVDRPAQEVVLDEAAKLEDGDLLFVDSTHTVKPGSEVNTLILEVLPALVAGAWVHFHDIMFPYDYPRRIIKSELFVHGETPLLFAFLNNNARYDLKVAMSMLHYEAPDELKRLIPNYAPAGNDEGLQTIAGHFPSAAYLRAK